MTTDQITRTAFVLRKVLGITKPITHTCSIVSILQYRAISHRHERALQFRLKQSICMWRKHHPIEKSCFTMLSISRFDLCGLDWKSIYTVCLARRSVTYPIWTGTLVNDQRFVRHRVGCPCSVESVSVDNGFVLCCKNHLKKQTGQPTELTI